MLASPPPCIWLLAHEESRWRDLNSQPRLYESRALPLSYIGDQNVYSTAPPAPCKAP